MFPKDSWEVNDKVVVQNIHGKIVEFNSTGNRVKIEHRDNENQAYLRWYDVRELPPFGTTETASAKFVEGQRVRLTRDFHEANLVNLYKGDEGIVVQHPTEDALGFEPDDWDDMYFFERQIDGEMKSILDFCEAIPTTPILTLKKADEVLFAVTEESSPVSLPSPTLSEGEKPETLSSAGLIDVVTGDDLPDDVAALKQIIRGQRTRLANQAASIEELMTRDIESIQDKFEQLHEDYEALAKKMAAIEDERDALKKVNAQQSELLKTATQSPAPAFSTDVNPQKLIDSLRAENAQLHRDLDKALKSPHDALELRLARLEEKLSDKPPVDEQKVVAMPPDNVLLAFSLFRAAWDVAMDKTAAGEKYCPNCNEPYIDECPKCGAETEGMDG